MFSSLLMRLPESGCKLYAYDMGIFNMQEEIEKAKAFLLKTSSVSNKNL